MENNNLSPENVPLISKEETEDDHSTKMESKEQEAEDQSLAGQEHTLPSWQILMHLVKACLGVGILGIPSGIYHTGIAAGPVTLILIGVFSFYGMVLLTSTNAEISKRTGIESYTYGNLAKEIITSHSKSWGYFSKLFLDAILCAMQLGFCTVYFEFFGATMAKILNNPHPRLWTAAFLPVVLGLALVTNMRKLVYPSTVANIAMMIVILILMQYFVPKMKPRQDNLITNEVMFLVGFGQFLYSYEGIGTMPTLQNKMQNKENFKVVLVVTQILVTTLYFLFGVTGYLAFGSKTKPSVTLNLPNEPLYRALNGIYILISLFSYPIQFIVPIEIIKSYTDEQLLKRRSILVEVCLRASLVLFTFALAIAVPQLDNYMALIGCSTATIVTFIFPSILHTLCFWDKGLSRWQLISNAGILVFGVISFSCGTYSSIASIIQRFKNPNAP